MVYLVVLDFLTLLGVLESRFSLSRSNLSVQIGIIMPLSMATLLSIARRSNEEKPRDYR